MKTNIIVILALLLGSICVAQSGINYKAIIKDDNGDAIANESIIVQFAIRTENNSLLYAENHSVITNDNGLVVLQIGEGTPVFQTYNNVDWSLGNLALQVNVDSGNGLVNMGVTPFNIVPYAIETLNPVFTKDGDNAFKEIGSIGIGTNNPQRTLDVVGSTRIQGSLQLNDGSIISSFSTNPNLGTSDTNVPTQNAVKTYVDNYFKVPEPYILGRSVQSSNGRFEFGGKYGWQAAQKMCEASYPNTPSVRAFTLEQITQALVLENYNENNLGNIHNVQFYAITPITYSVTENSVFETAHENNAYGLNSNNGAVSYATYATILIEDPGTFNGDNPLKTYLRVDNRVGPFNFLPCMCGTYITN